MRRMIFSKQLRRFLADLIAPNKCPICMRAIKWDKYICDSCNEQLPFLNDDSICHKCGRVHQLEEPCESSHRFDGVFGVMWYKDKGKKAIYNFKRRYTLNLAELAAVHIYKQFETNDLLKAVDCVTYVPMHIKKEYKRGYNQAEEYARALSEALGVPLVGGMLEHKKTNTQQHELTGQERREAARSTYTLGKRKREPNEKVCIITDDVFTTGSTLDVCAGLLKSIGFEKVICVSICITPKKLADDEYEEDYEYMADE